MQFRTGTRLGSVFFSLIHLFVQGQEQIRPELANDANQRAVNHGLHTVDKKANGLVDLIAACIFKMQGIEENAQSNERPSDTDEKKLTGNEINIIFNPLWLNGLPG